LLIASVVCSSSCTTQAPPASSKPEPATSATPPAIIALYPRETPAGKPFNTQPGGSAAIAIKCQNATSKTVILWDGDPLVTAFGSPEAVTALVPSKYYSAPGAHVIMVENETGKSNPMAFFVRP